MKMNKLIAGISLALTVAPAWAQDAAEEAVSALASVPPGDASAWIAARDRVVRLGEAALPVLARVGAPDRWTADGWVTALAAEVCRVRIQNPALAASVDRPRGLDPAIYRKFRKPEPMCAAEFVHKGADAVPLLLERWRWTMADYSFSEGRAGEQEADALRYGILHAPGALGDARARHFMAEVLGTREGAPEWRQMAAVGYAQCAGREALRPLAARLDSAEEHPAVREACARALGWIPVPAALETLQARLDQDWSDGQIRRSILSAFGLLGSSWAWEARGAAARPTADAVRKGCAEVLVESIRRWPAESETIGRALAMTAWPESLAAVEGLAAEPELRRSVDEILGVLRPAVDRK